MNPVIDVPDDVADPRAIQALSETLNVPELKVIEIYKTEYRRLSAECRIATYVSVLAMRNTRTILKKRRSLQLEDNVCLSRDAPSLS